ncbi:MAG: phosphoribosylaminoimidazolesuccinocarboxamide synthase [Aquificaceae bacterium]
MSNISFTQDSRKLYEGKAKALYEIDKEQILMVFKDSATAFNAKKSSNIQGKGELCCEISCELFKYLETKGIKTHFLKKHSENSMVVLKTTRLDIEVVLRNFAEGSIVNRLKVERGKEFKKPLLEFYLKNDELGDPIICESHIIALEIANSQTLNKIKTIARRVNSELFELFKKINLRLVDIKLEFGIKDGEILLIDELSPDNMRLRDKDDKSFDKDNFRFDLGDIKQAYKEVLSRLRALSK